MIKQLTTMNDKPMYLSTNSKIIKKTNRNNVLYNQTHDRRKDVLKNPFTPPTAFVNFTNSVFNGGSKNNIKEQIADLRIDNSVADLVSKTANRINSSQQTLHRGLNSLVRECGTKCIFAIPDRTP
jgi:hypothetical protein